MTWSQFKSAYRKRHAMETALLRVVDDVDAAADNEEIVCVDLSAAFDTVSDETLLDRRL